MAPSLLALGDQTSKKSSGANRRVGGWMVDSLERWCLFCDLEFHALHPRGPQPILDDYVDELVAMADRREARRVFENGNRVTRIEKAKRCSLPDGTEALAMLITLGDKRGADPSFLHFDQGTARDPDKMEGEVKGASAHCMLRIAEDAEVRGRHRLLIEEVRGIGRTPVTRLLASVFREIAKDRGERFRNPDTGRIVGFVPIAEVHPRQSREMGAAFGANSFLPVELIDTRPVPAFDENPEYKVRRHQLSVKVKPGPSRSMKEALTDLAALASHEGYTKMRVTWRAPGQKKGGSAEMNTDLADIGTALFAHREIIELQQPLSECAGDLCDEFVDAMASKFA